MTSPSSSNDPSLTLNSFIHMLSIKLGSTNYVLWKNHMVPILTYQNLIHHVDSLATATSPTIAQAEKLVDNPDYKAWTSVDQRTVIVLHASLRRKLLRLLLVYILLVKFG
jgi:hypothetical protein